MRIGIHTVTFAI